MSRRLTNLSFLSRWFETVPKQGRRGTTGKKLAQQKKSYLFSTKGIQPNKELHKKKSKSINKKFFWDISLKGPSGPKLQYTTPHVRLTRDRLRKAFLEFACERDFKAWLLATAEILELRW